jgi:hypothetical protein
MRAILQGKAILIGLLLAVGVLMAQGPARADTISAIIAADNHFTFYVGDATGSTLTYIGRNMYGAGNDNGDNWQQAVTFSGVTVQPGQYLYVVAWNLDGPQMWIGEFTKSDGTKLYSNTTDWVYKVGSGLNPGDDGDLVYSTVQKDIAPGVWAQPQVQDNFQDNVWGGAIDTFDPETLAKYLWHDTFDEGSSSQSSYAIFRTAAPVTHTPVPPTVLLLGSGLVGLGLLRGKRGLKQ